MLLQMALFLTPLYMCNLKRNYTNELRYKTETDSQTLRMRLGLLGKRRGKGQLGSLGTLRTDYYFIIDNQQGLTV